MRISGRKSVGLFVVGFNEGCFVLLRDVRLTASGGHISFNIQVALRFFFSDEFGFGGGSGSPISMLSSFCRDGALMGLLEISNDFPVDPVDPVDLADVGGRLFSVGDIL